MPVDPYIVLGSAVVGFLVGLTGAGGGALMTPMLILLFGIKPSTAISSDLVAAVVMRGQSRTVVHLTKGTVNLRLVGWLVLGSAVPDGVHRHLLAAPAGRCRLSRRRPSRPSWGPPCCWSGAAAMISALSRPGPPKGQRPSGDGGRTDGEAATDRGHRDDRRTGGGPDVGGIRVADDRLSPVLVPCMLGANQLVGTDLTPGRPASPWPRPWDHWPSDLRGVLGDDVVDHRERPRGAGRFIPVPHGHPDRYIRPRHHLRHLCFGAQIRGGGHHRPWGGSSVRHHYSPEPPCGWPYLRPWRKSGEAQGVAAASQCRRGLIHP